MSFSAIILAGGQSRRMGQDKALLNWHGRPLYEVAQSLARRLGAGQVLLSGPQVGGLADRYPGQGPLAGIDACLQKAEFDWVLVLPVDMPQLRAEALAPLVEQTQAAYLADSPLPAWLPNSARVRDWLGQQLADPEGERSVKSLLRFVEAGALPCKAPLGNCNTPEDWQTLLGG